jgi:hypothetical protein
VNSSYIAYVIREKKVTVTRVVRERRLRLKLIKGISINVGEKCIKQE